MENMVTLEVDGKEMTFAATATIHDIVAKRGTAYAKKAVAAVLDGELVGLATPVREQAKVEILTIEDDRGLDVLRHSSAHLLAQALRRLYPEVKLAIGPTTDQGFYYDISMSHTLSEEDLPRIEEVMREIVAEDQVISRAEMSRKQALLRFSDDPFKVELIDDLPPEAVITVYTQGEFSDLCRGPHVPRTGVIQSFRLLNLAGAYWRGDAKRPMLQRIYGTAFATEKQLKAYLHQREEAQKRDHRKVGKALQLFWFSPEAPGMPFYLPNGLVVRSALEGLVRGFQQQAGYQEVRTPMLLHERLWEQSGHLRHYRENMYFTEDEGDSYVLKPMNCPAHMLLFKHKLRSYRELPLRISEFGHVHRRELSGALGGLLRVRAFTQDDAHIFVREDQIGSEVEAVLALIDQLYKVFGFAYEIELSTRPDSSMGEDSLWQKAEGALLEVLQRGGVKYRVQEGEGAFYGPKIDVHLFDALQRRHQCATIQLDFQLPRQFDLTYVGSDNSPHRPVVIHRALYGSLERFLAILIEHYAGAFPFWLAPVQAKVLSIAAPFADYATQVGAALQAAGFRVEVDTREEKLGYKVREGDQQKVPFLLVVGEQEMAAQTVNVRQRQPKHQFVCSVEELIHQHFAALAQGVRW